MRRGEPSGSPRRNEPDVVLDSYFSLGSDLGINQQIQQSLALLTYRKAPEMLIMLINVDNVDNSGSKKAWLDISRISR